MSKPKFDSDGFQIVTSKRYSRNKITKIPTRSIKLEKQQIVIDTEKAIRRIHSAVDDLRGSKYLENFSKSVSISLRSREVLQIVCFGLGHIGECNISRYQLALLLCLKEFCGAKKVLVHDPVFYDSECDILQHLDLDIIKENCEGHYIISERDITIVYLPHCPKQLTNNFLWSNWGTELQNCVVICNSFTSLIDNLPSRSLSESVPYICKIYPQTSEISLENNFKYTDIFNDTSIHYFPKEVLDKIDSNFWLKGDKPQYENSEEFITSLMIEKLNI